MHDLFFGAKLHERGIKLTHLNGLHSQPPAFYASKALNITLRKYSSTNRQQRGLWTGRLETIGRAAVFHYMTGPFMRWLQAVFTAADAHKLHRDSIHLSTRLVTVLFLPSDPSLQPHFVAEPALPTDCAANAAGVAERALRSLLCGKLLVNEEIDVQFIEAALADDLVRIVRNAAIEALDNSSPLLLIVNRFTHVVPAGLLALMRSVSVEEENRVFVGSLKAGSIDARSGFFVSSDLASKLAETEYHGHTVDDGVSSLAVALERIAHASGVKARHHDGFLRQSLQAISLRRAVPVVTVPLWLTASAPDNATADAIAALCADRNNRLKQYLPCSIYEMQIVAHAAFSPHPPHGERSHRRPECASNDFGDLLTCWSTSNMIQVSAAKSLDSSSGDATAREVAGKLPGSDQTTVILQNRQLSDEGAKALAGAIPASMVSVMDLGGNAIGDLGAKALAAALSGGALAILALHDNAIGNVGAKALAARFPDTDLASLDLSNNFIGDKGALALARAAGKPQSSLAKLDLRGTQISAAAALQVTEMAGSRCVVLLGEASERSAVVAVQPSPS